MSIEAGGVELNRLFDELRCLRDLQCALVQGCRANGFSAARSEVSEAQPAVVRVVAWDDVEWIATSVGGGASFQSAQLELHVRSDPELISASQFCRYLEAQRLAPGQRGEREPGPLELADAFAFWAERGLVQPVAGEADLFRIAKRTCAAEPLLAGFSHLQQTLASALVARLHPQPLEPYRHIGSGELVVAGTHWTYTRHGIGVTFRSSTETINAHVGLARYPGAIDCWRLYEYLCSLAIAHVTYGGELFSVEEEPLRRLLSKMAAAGYLRGPTEQFKLYEPTDALLRHLGPRAVQGSP